MDDKDLREAVMDELDFEPSVSAAHIGVTAERGVVTLTGHVASYAEKVAAERAAMRVRGVHAVAQEIEVRYPEDKKTSDDEIAQRALRVLSWHAGLPADAVQVKVQGGWVTLTGQVGWQFQRSDAEAAVRKLSGVVGITNQIGLPSSPAAQVSEVERKIKDALRRHADVEAGAIHVSCKQGGTVELEGRVQSWNERWLAERAAWSVPGVKMVNDRLMVA